MSGVKDFMTRDSDEAGKAFSGPAIILVEPQLGENIGAAARAMANFGLSELCIVKPRDGWPNEKARASAALAVEIVDKAMIAPSLEDSLKGFHFVAATSARSRYLAKPVMSPEGAVDEIFSRIASGQRCCVLFGKERTGLENADIALADVIVTAPVDPAYASLNLAQATLLVAYEWRKRVDPASLGRKAGDTPIGPGDRFKASRPAERPELIAFFHHLEAELDACGFLFPPAKRETMVNNIRTMFTRMAPTEQEVRTLRGIVANLRRGPWNGPPSG